MTKLVYIASPVRGVLESVLNEKYQQEIILKLAQDGCSRVKKAGHIPVSPVLAFNGVYNEWEERVDIDNACSKLLKLCDEIMVVKSSYNKYSKGIQAEIKIAQEHGITQVEY